MAPSTGRVDGSVPSTCTRTSPRSWPSLGELPATDQSRHDVPRGGLAGHALRRTSPGPTLSVPTTPLVLEVLAAFDRVDRVFREELS